MGCVTRICKGQWLTREGLLIQMLTLLKSGDLKNWQLLSLAYLRLFLAFFGQVHDYLSKLRLGAQSVTLLSILRDPTQLRDSQCITRQ